MLLNDMRMKRACRYEVGDVLGTRLHTLVEPAPDTVAEGAPDSAQRARASKTVNEFGGYSAPRRVSGIVGVPGRAEEFVTK